MFNELFGRLNRKESAPVSFNPARIEDPVAQRTEWKPLVGGCRYYRTLVLKEDGPERLRFEQAGARAGYLLVVGMGAVLALGWGSIILTEGIGSLASGLVLLLPVVAGAVMVAVGWRGLQKGSPSLVFDRHRGAFWKGGVDADPIANPDSLETFVRLDRAHALQLVAEWCRSPNNEYRSYELNLVLDDAARIPIVAHSNRAQMREDAGRLARFLELPLWDGTR